VAGGLALAVLAFAMIGAGCQCRGHLAAGDAGQARGRAERRAGAAALVWLMMIVGFAVTAGVTGRFSTPTRRLGWWPCPRWCRCIAMAVTLLALWRLERQGRGAVAAPADAPMTSLRFRQALRRSGPNPTARRFTVFVFVSMLAYSAQDLILEPFAGLPCSASRRASRRSCRACSMAAARWPACCSRRWPAGVCGHRLRVAAHLDRRGCLASCVALAGLASPALAAPRWRPAGRCAPRCSRWAWPTARSRSPPSDR
jgi:BCD family chlorophyll transporter-like MFS transporter